MGFFKSIFGGDRSSGGDSNVYDNAEIVAQDEEERKFLQHAQGLTHSKEYDEAVRNILRLMDLHRDRRRFYLFTAATILRCYVRDRDVKPIDPCLYGDERLDSIFMHCPRDNTIWLPMNQIKGGHYAVPDVQQRGRPWKAGQAAAAGIHDRVFYRNQGRARASFRRMDAWAREANHLRGHHS